MSVTTTTDDLLEQIEDLTTALGESLALQRHYAMLLNQYDGGERMRFTSVEEWMARLRSIGKLPKR